MVSLLRFTQKYYLNFLRLKPLNYMTKSKKTFSDNAVLDVNTNVQKDVVLFKYDNPRFFKIVNIFAVSQFLFWSYLSVFTFSGLKDIPVDKEKSKDLPWWRTINLGETKTRNFIAIGSFLIGYGILAVTWTYTLKSVRYLVLCQGGNHLSFVTYTPFLKNNRILTVNLKNVSCQESRQRATSQLPIKVKGHYLYYILDMRGEFKNPLLFDHTAGIKRKFRTAP